MRADKLSMIPSIVSIADIGASAKRGYFFLRTFYDAFDGPVYAVKPGLGGKTIDEMPRVRCVDRLADIPATEPVDFAFVETPREAVPGIVQDCIEKGVKLVAIFSAGFADAGDETGLALQARIDELLRGVENPPAVIGPNGMGLFVPAIGLRWRPTLPLVPGPAGIVAQSGGLCNLLVHGLVARGIGISAALSIGNAADVTAVDVLHYLGSDSCTRFIIAYIEGTGHGQGRALLDAIAAVGKPVIAVKGGLSAQGSRAAGSHTAALAGDARAWYAALRQAGAIVASSFQDILDISSIVDARGVTATCRAAVVSMSGGYAVICSDVLAAHGIDVPPLGSGEMTGPWRAGTSLSNPVDVGATIYDTRAYARIIDTILTDESIDCIIAEIAPFYVAHPMNRNVDLATELPAILGAARSKRDVTIIAIVENTGDDETKKRLVEALRAAGIPACDDILHVARALQAVTRAARDFSANDASRARR